MIDYFFKGGLLMWPILLCSIAALAVFLERFCVLRREGKNIMRPAFIAEVKRLLCERKYDAVERMCERQKGPLSAVIAVGVRERSRNFDERERAVSRTGAAEMRRLERHLSVLSLVADIAPLLGLTGTVTGLIKAFIKVQALGGRVDAASLAGGIWEALITTAAGLFVAIPALAAYHFLERKIVYYASVIKDVAGETLDLTGMREIDESAKMETESDDRI
jgi:biopolymer transport protein ExbB